MYVSTQTNQSLSYSLRITQRKEKQAKEATNATCIGGRIPGWSTYSVKKSCPNLCHSACWSRLLLQSERSQTATGGHGVVKHCTCCTSHSYPARQRTVAHRLSQYIELFAQSNMHISSSGHHLIHSASSGMQVGIGLHCALMHWGICSRQARPSPHLRLHVIAS